MKNKKINILLLASILTICGVGLSSCGKKGGVVSNTPISETESESVNLTVSETSVTMNINEQHTLTATCDNETQYLFTWSSSDRSIVTVSKGVLTAVGEGKATITVSVKKKGTTKVLETKDVEVTVYNKSISLDKTEITISMLESPTATIVATVTDNEAVTWTSSDPTIATVEGGVVTALKGGSVVITATAGTLVATCNVQIYGHYFALNEIAQVVKGETATLTMKEGEAPADAVWTSLDPSIATVAGGVVTGVKEGIAKVTCSSVSDGVVTTAYVIVKGNQGLEKAELTQGKKAVAAQNAGTWFYLLENDINSTVKEVPTYDNGVIDINITHVGKEDGEISGANMVYLRYQPDAEGDIIYKEVLYIYNENEALLSINGGADTSYEAGLNKIEVDYTSLNPSNSSPAQIKFKSMGQFYIVPVFEKVGEVEKMTLSESKKTLKEGEELTLTATVPNQANPEVSWLSSDEDVATVDATGKVSAKKAGVATITAVCDSYSATCVITVEGSEPEAPKTELTSGNKSATLANAGTYYYLADGKTSMLQVPTIDENGVINFNVASVDEANKKYAYLRYQPVDQGTYKATIKITLAGADTGSIDLTGGDAEKQSLALVKGENNFEYTFATNTTTPLQFKVLTAGNYTIEITLTPANA